MSPTHFKRLARRLGGAQLAPRPSALRRLTRAKVAQGTPENPAAPALPPPAPLALASWLYYTTLRTALHYHRYAADYVGRARVHRALTETN